MHFSIDDIIDGGKISGEKSAPHIVFGIPSTVICGEYANFKLTEKVKQLDNKEVLESYIDFGLSVNFAQAIEVYWRENFLCPSFSDYIMMVRGKAGIPFKFFVKVIQAFSENKTDYNELLVLLGKHSVSLYKFDSTYNFISPKEQSFNY